MTAQRQRWTWRRFFVYLATLVAMLIIVGVMIDQVILPSIVSSTRTILVPDVVGLDEDDARTRLQDLGLVVMEPHEQVSEDHPEGTVIQQMPYEGATVKEGRRIYLTVSAGKETALLPDVVGMTTREARLNLMRLGLSVGDITMMKNDSIMEDRVITQSVPSGERVPAGSRIDLVVSEGPLSITMPDLLGYSLADANAVLKEFGLEVGAITRLPTGALEPNTVLSTEPAADSLVQPGSAVKLTITR